MSQEKSNMSRASQTWPWHAMACYSNWKGRTFQSAMLRQTQVYTSTERCGSGTGLGQAGLQCWQCLNSREKAVIIIWSQVCLGFGQGETKPHKHFLVLLMSSTNPSKLQLKPTPLARQINLPPNQIAANLHTLTHCIRNQT